MADPWFHRLPFFTNLLAYFKGTDHPEGVDPYLIRDQQLATFMDSSFRVPQARKQRYDLYDRMDCGYISGILDAYAEEATILDYETGKTVWVESNNSEIVNACNKALAALQVEDRAFSIARQTAKMGDHPRRLALQAGVGVYGWIPASLSTFERIEDSIGRLVGFRPVISEKEAANSPIKKSPDRSMLFPWEMIHFRMLGRTSDEVYGQSVLDPMVRPWRQLAFAEDSAMLWRLRKGADRRMFKVDVRNLNRVDARRYLETFAKSLTLAQFIDPASGQYKTDYNPYGSSDDLVLPVTRADSLTGVESIAPSGNIGEMFDVDHFRSTLLGTAKVPPAYFGGESGGVFDSKASLAQQDTRFARVVKNIQRRLIVGFRTALDVHLILNGGTLAQAAMDPESYRIRMSPVSYLDERERLELTEIRNRIVNDMANLAQSLGLDGKAWAIYVLHRYAKLPDDLIVRLLTKRADGKTKDSEKTEKEDSFEAAQGYYTLNETERRAIHGHIAESPWLTADLERLQSLLVDKGPQRDPSLSWFYDSLRGNGPVGAGTDLQALNEAMKGMRK